MAVPARFVGLAAAALAQPGCAGRSCETYHRADAERGLAPVLADIEAQVRARQAAGQPLGADTMLAILRGERPMAEPLDVRPAVYDEIEP